MEVGNPGDACFQRAARAAQSWDDAAIILEWIFAVERAYGYGNVLKAADDVLSRRSSSAETMASG